MKKKAFITSLRQTIAFRMIFPVFLLVVLGFIIYRVNMAGCIFPTHLDDKTSISDIYPTNKYVSCSPETLYYSGYDYIIGNRILGHYYYTLVDGKCTFYLMSDKFVSSVSDHASTLYDTSFRAKLKADSSTLLDLTSLMAGDLNWTTDGLRSHVTSIFVSELNYSLTWVITLTAILALISGCAIIHLAVLIHDMVHPLRAICITHSLKKDRSQLLYQACYQLESSAEALGDGIYVTEDYLIRIQLHQIHIIPLTDFMSMSCYVSMHGLPMRRHPAANIHFAISGRKKAAHDHSGSTRTVVKNTKNDHLLFSNIATQTADLLLDIMADEGIDTIKM